jgi:hypothetical protein
MRSARVRLAARIAAIEAFREDRQRQQLAVARHASASAEAELTSAELTWRELEEKRTLALAVHQDLARYVLWGDLSAHACDVHALASAIAAKAEEAATDASLRWADARVRADATDDRAARVDRDDMSAVEVRVFADAMDLWLSRTRRNA